MVSYFTSFCVASMYLWCSVKGTVKGNDKTFCLLTATNFREMLVETNNFLSEEIRAHTQRTYFSASKRPCSDKRCHIPSQTPRCPQGKWLHPRVEKSLVRVVRVVHFLSPDNKRFPVDLSVDKWKKSYVKVFKVKLNNFYFRKSRILHQS